MIEKISLRIFWTCLFACAVTFLTVIWIPLAESPDDWMPLRMQVVMTFFVIGLAAFLVWLPLVTYRLQNLAKK